MYLTKDVPEQSMGTWFFDKRTRKRKYVALSGKVYTGQEALKISRHDKYSPTHPAQFLRSQLIDLARAYTSDHLLFMSSTYGAESLSCLAAWGLPNGVVQEYARHHVTTLFPWQIDCLLAEQGVVFDGTLNLVFSAPTSGGKTLVAEMLMLRRMAQSMVLGDPKDTVRRSVMYVVPYLSLAEEKAEHFRSVWKGMSISVKTFHNADSGGSKTGLTSDVEVAVCTIERANLLLNQLLAARSEQQLQLVVVDEMHMMGDNPRGAVLEIFLTKLRLLCGHTQVVGMSATLPNMPQLAQWVGACVFQSRGERPLPLDIYVLSEKKIYLHQPTAGTSSTLPIPPPPVPPTSLYSSYLPSYSCSSSNSPPILDVYTPLPSLHPHLTDMPSLYPSSDCSLYSLINDDGDGRGGAWGHTMETGMVTASRSLFDQVTGKSSFATSANEAVVIEGRTKTPLCISPLVFPYIRDLPPLPQDDDGFFSLALTYLQRNLSALIFCPSRSRCESTVKSLLKSISWIEARGGMVAEGDSKTSITTLRKQLVDDLLSMAAAPPCPLLLSSLPHGIAYHHAGLSLDERSLLETAFRAGAVQLLCTTSTLSTGVNLPAHAVLLRSLNMGGERLSVGAFKQMCGRAGRLGGSGGSMSSGEVVVVLEGAGMQRGDGEALKKLLLGELEPLCSVLMAEDKRAAANSSGGVEGKGVGRYILELICTGRLKEESEVLPALSQTFLARSLSAGQLEQITEKVVWYLRKEQFVLLSPSPSSPLLPSQLGLATVMAGLSPPDALLALPELKAARSCLHTRTSLHLLYLCIPSHAHIHPDWAVYEQMVDRLYREYPVVEQLGGRLGINRAVLCQSKFRPPSAPSLVYQRFYLAVLLFSLLSEYPLPVQGSTSLGRGQLQQLQRDAGIQASMLSVFCATLNWPLLASALEEIGSRLTTGVATELRPLVRIGQEVTASRAKCLFEAGIKDAGDVISCGVERIASVLLRSMPHRCSNNSVQSRGSRALDENNSDAVNREAREMEGCVRLSRIIVQRAEQFLKQEIERKSA